MTGNSWGMSKMDTKNRKIKVGIIGTGFIADLHADVLKRINNLSIAGCCDISRGQAESFAKRWNLPYAFTDMNTFIEQQHPDVIHVLVPPDYHFPIAKSMMEKGVNLFLEKPMCLNADQCRELVQTAQNCNVKIGINHNFLFYPLFQRLQKDLASGRIGKPEYVTAFYGGPLGQLDFGKFGHWMFQEPGNIILEQGPHPISQIREILGDIVHMTANAAGKRELGKDQFFYDRWQAIAQCEKGHAFLHLSFGNRYASQRTLYVYGQDGAITVDFLNNTYLIQEKSVFPDYLDPTANALRYFPPVIEGIKGFADYALSKLKIKDRTDAFFMTMKNSITAFYEAFSSGADLPCSGEDGYKVIESCEKWIHAANILPNPQPVKLPVVQQDSGEKAEILLTGAGGFIGGAFAEHLIAKGIRIRVLVRNPKGLRPALHSPLVQILKGDMTDPDTIEKAVKGVKYVYHLAHALGKTWDDFHRLNVIPSLAFAKACLKENVRYFVFASSIAAYYYNDIPRGQDVSGMTPIDTKPGKRNLYAASKIIIENMLMDMAKKQNLPLVIVRPGIVVGKNGILNHGGVGQWTRDNVCAYWGEGRNELPFVLVEDVADALEKIMHTDGLDGKALNLAGDVRLNAREYIHFLRKYSGRNIRAFPYPVKLCFLSETLKYMIKYMTGERGGLLSYRDIANRSVPARFDCTEEKSLLQWQPCADREKFLENAIVWAFDERKI